MTIGDIHSNNDKIVIVGVLHPFWGQFAIWGAPQPGQAVSENTRGGKNIGLDRDQPEIKKNTKHSSKV